jgi:hypothetical protein
LYVLLFANLHFNHHEVLAGVFDRRRHQLVASCRSAVWIRGTLVGNPLTHFEPHPLPTNRMLWKSDAQRGGCRESRLARLHCEPQANYIETLCLTVMTQNRYDLCFRRSKQWPRQDDFPARRKLARDCFQERSPCLACTRLDGLVRMRLGIRVRAPSRPHHSGSRGELGSPRSFRWEPAGASSCHRAGACYTSRTSKDAISPSTLLGRFLEDSQPRETGSWQLLLGENPPR